MKLSKKILSIVLSVLMVVSTMPFTVLTANAATLTETVYKDRFGIVTDGSESRFSNSKFNIVNDQEQKNTSAGVIHYDLTKFQNTKISNVTFYVTLDSTSADSSIEYMNYYYSTKLNNDSTYLSVGGKETMNANIGYGDKNYAPARYTNHFGIDGGLLAQTARTTSTGTFDVTSKIKALIDAGKTDLYIIVMHSNAGGSGSSKGWSDTTVDPAKLYLQISYDSYDSSTTDGKKAYIDANISDWNLPKATNVLYFGTDTGISNALYSSNTYLDQSAIEFSLNQNSTDTKMNAKVMAGSNRIVYMYTGDKSVAKVPLNVETDKPSTVLKSYKLNYLISANSNWTLNNSNWYAPSNRYSWDRANESGKDGLYVVSSDSSHNAEDYTSSNRPKDAEGQYNFENIVSYNGAVSFSNGYAKLENPSIDMSFDGWCSWREGLSTKYSYQNNITKDSTGVATAVPTLTVGSDASYYLVDFSTMNSMYSSVKDQYDNVSKNASKYTADSLASYYNAVYNLITFKPATYNFSTDEGIQNCIKDMNSVISVYNTAYAGLQEVPRDHTVTFQFNDGTTTQRTVTYNTAIGEFPANTAITPAGNGFHNVYSWNTSLTPSTVISEDVKISESASPEFCVGGTATCSSKKVCTICNGEYGNVDPNAHSYSTNASPNYTSNSEKANDITYQHAISCDNNASHDKKNDACTFERATDLDVAATQTTEGKEYERCSVCGGTRYTVIEKLPPEITFDVVDRENSTDTSSKVNVAISKNDENKTVVKAEIKPEDKANGTKFIGWYDNEGNLVSTKPEYVVTDTSKPLTVKTADRANDGYSLGMNGQVDCNVYIDALYYVDDVENSKIEVTYNQNGTTYAQDFVTVTKTGADVINRDNEFFFTTGYAPAQITEQISYKVYEKGILVYDSNDSNANASIEKYCAAVIGGGNRYSDELKNLCQSVINYGSAAQGYFDGVTSPDVATATTPVANLTTADVEAYKPTIQQTSVSKADFQVTDMTFMSLDNSAIRFYYTGSLEGYTVTVDGAVVTPQSKVVDGKTYNYFEVSGIAAADLDALHDIRITKDSKIAFYAKASALSYVYLGVNNAPGALQNYKTFLATLVDYNIKNKEYKASQKA